MRWSVFAGLIFVALLVIGVRSIEPESPPAVAVAVAHAGPPARPNARGESAALEWQDKVESRPFVKRDEARSDAVARAQERLTDWLREKHPGIRYRPTA